MKARRLTLKQRVFVDKLTDPSSPTFLNQTQSYKASHPTAVAYNGMAVSASQALTNPKVRQAVTETLERRGITKEMIESDLLEYKSWAKEKRDYVAGASIAMDCAKLGGFLVEKREIISVDDAARTALRDLVKQSLAPAKDS